MYANSKAVCQAGFPVVDAGANDRQDLPPALRARKVSFYPQVMAYPTSGPKFVASLDGRLSKGHGTDGRGIS